MLSPPDPEQIAATSNPTPNQAADRACPLRAENVSRVYRLGDVDVRALKGINLSIREGDFLAIAGSSGSGKTTLLNLLGAIDRPSGGRILIDGVDTAKLAPRELSYFRSRRLGFIFQTFNLLPVLTARENVEYP